MTRNKLSTNAGATLVLALIFFLLCAVAGSVILIAGSGAAGRLADLKQDQQAYYSVTSAAKVLKSEIADQEYYVSGGRVDTTSESISALDGLISQGIVYSGSSDYLVNNCTMDCNDTEADGRLDVIFDFRMSKNNVITILVKKNGPSNNIEYESKLIATPNISSDKIIWPIDKIYITK